MRRTVSTIGTLLGLASCEYWTEERPECESPTVWVEISQPAGGATLQGATTIRGTVAFEDGLGDRFTTLSSRPVIAEARWPLLLWRVELSEVDLVSMRQPDGMLPLRLQVVDTCGVTHLGACEPLAEPPPSDDDDDHDGPSAVPMTGPGDTPGCIVVDASEVAAEAPEDTAATPPP